MNPFRGLDAATLSQLKTAYTNAVIALASNQSYSLNGRSLTRSSLTEVKATLGQIVAAQQELSGEGVSETHISFTGL